MVDKMDVFWAQVMELAAVYVPKIVLAILTLIVGMWAIGAISNRLKRKLAARDSDTSLQEFVATLVGMTLRVALIVVIAGMVGIETASFVALIGAVGLAVGLALQGSLANFAGGVMILFYKPFKVGHYIEGAGHSGTVNEIQIFHTILKTPDNKRVIIPNAELSNDSIINYSVETTRRVDFLFGIGYDDDISKAKQILRRLADEDERVLREPEPFIAVKEHGDSSINLTMRVWSATGDYWPIFWDMMEKVKVAFDDEGINIPYPQRDVHLIRENGGGDEPAGERDTQPKPSA